MPGVKNPMCNAFPRIGHQLSSSFSANSKSSSYDLHVQRLICSCVWVIFSRLGNTQIRASQSSSSNHLHPCQNLFGENCFKIAVPGLDNVQTDHFIYSLLWDFYSLQAFYFSTIQTLGPLCSLTLTLKLLYFPVAYLYSK